MINRDAFKSVDADAECGNFAHTIWNLAMENETSGIHEEDRAGAVADLFEVMRP